MNVGDNVVISSGEPGWDGAATVVSVEPPVTTQEWLFVEYEDGRRGYIPSKYAEPA